MLISEFEKRVAEGLIRRTENEDLVLYCYTDLCVYSKAWDEYTSQARGIILNKNGGNIVARPIGKFWNLGEVQETFLQNLPNLPYEVTEKLDGSLGILYYFNGWKVATKGSLNSVQAQEAMKIIEEKYNLSMLDKSLTLLFEIIYPENKIVVEYNGDRKLVLLAGYYTDSGVELNRHELFELTKQIGCELVSLHNITIEDMIALQLTLPKDREGFVVRYSNGLRVKIKGEEYLKVHRIISNLSPLSVWASMSNGKVPTEYVIQVPDEHRYLIDPIVNELQSQYAQVYSEILQDVEKVPYIETEENYRKKVGLFLQKNKLKHERAVFPVLLKSHQALEKYIMKAIRPRNNEFNDL